MTEHLSRKMAYALRHNPHRFGLRLNPVGAAKVTELARAMGATVGEIQRIVAEDPKGRFAFDLFGTTVRATHGHSIIVGPVFAATVAPEWLYHGTKAQNIESIVERGLLPMERNHVHMHASATKALDRGPVVIQIRTEGIDGLVMASNGIWLAPWVPSANLYFF